MNKEMSKLAELKINELYDINGGDIEDYNCGYRIGKAAKDAWNWAKSTASNAWNWLTSRF